MSISLYRLLSYGEPVILRQISETTGIARRIVRDAIARWPGIKRNSDGAIVGHCGLSVLPTKHRFLVDGRELYTWCAWDTLFIPELLRAAAQVESVCPISGTRVSLRISPKAIESAKPDTTALSFVIPKKSEIEDGVMENFCCHVNFFNSLAEGEEWRSANPRIILLSLTAAWRLGLRKNAMQYPLLGSLSSG